MLNIHYCISGTLPADIAKETPKLVDFTINIRTLSICKYLLYDSSFNEMKKQ